MKYLYLICFCLVVFISDDTFGQKNKKDSFISDLEKFKFSLYPYLDTMSYENLSLDKLPLNHPVSEYIQKFLDEHLSDISDYQNSVLKSYENNLIENSDYEKDTTFLKFKHIDVWNPGWEEKADNVKELKKYPIWNLLIINPIVHASFYLNMYLAHEYQPSEYGKRVLKDRIAGPIIKTVKIDKDRWSIFTSYYFDMYEFEYNCKNKEMVLKMRYIRK